MKQFGKFETGAENNSSPELDEHNPRGTLPDRHMLYDSSDDVDLILNITSAFSLISVLSLPGTSL